MTPEELFEIADLEAATLGAAAGPAELLAGAADREAGAAVRADLLAHGIAASHRVMLRLCAAANALLDWDRATSADPAADTAAADLSAAQVAATASRLMEQVRQGLATLQRCRPAALDEEGVWLAFSWLDSKCSDEELARRIAERKAARAAHAAGEAGARPLSEDAAARRAAAAAAAARLIKEAGAAAMAPIAGDERKGLGFLLHVFAHELGATHALMMRLAGAADRAIDRAVASRKEPAAALHLSGIVARLGDRYRRGMFTLDRLAGGSGGPGKVAGLVWGGADRGEAAPAPAAADTAGHGVLPQDSRPAAVTTAGHGVLRLVSSRPGRAVPLHGRPRADKTRHSGGLDRRAKAAGQGR